MSYLVGSGAQSFAPFTTKEVCMSHIARRYQGQLMFLVHFGDGCLVWSHDRSKATKHQITTAIRACQSWGIRAFAI